MTSSCCNAFGVTLALCWCPQSSAARWHNLHGTSVPQYFSSGDFLPTQPVYVSPSHWPAPCYHRKILSFRFLTLGYMSLYRIICLPTSYKWEAVVLQEETTGGLLLRDKVHFTVNNMLQVALGKFRTRYDLCQLFEQNLPPPVNTSVLYISRCGRGTSFN